MRFLATLLLLAATATAQTKTTFEERPALRLSNGVIELTVLERGATFASLVLHADPEKLNPLWNPIRMARELGQKPGGGDGLGHFVCVDGFGPVSAEEQAAGLRGHGEAHRQAFEIRSYQREGKVTTLVVSAQLPLLHELFTRTVRMVEGENVVYVDSRLESFVAFDRPAVWAEHATIGSPFLEAGVTVVDMPAARAKTRPHQAEPRLPYRLPSDADFTWPVAPLAGGGAANLRAAPASPNSGDHTTCLLDRSGKAGWVTALHPRKRLLVGWIFRTDEFPWVQNWENYPPTGKLARGLEFSTQPFDVPRREAVALNSLFDAPTYRWLPAKSAIEARFLMFYTRTPEGFTGVDDLRLEPGRIVIEDRTARKQITLGASLASNRGTL